MARLSVLFIALFWQLICRAQTTPPTSGSNYEEHFSPNGKFKVVLEIDRFNWSAQSPQEEGMTATMIEVTKGNSVRWRRRVAGDFSFDSVFVSEEGDYFAAVQRMEPVRVFGAESAQDFQTKDEPNLNYELVEIDHFEGRALLRIWSIQSNRWKAFPLPRMEELKVSDAMARRFAEQTRQRILKKVNASESRRLRQRITAADPRLERVAAFVTKSEKAPLPEDLELEFLTICRVPADRSIFEKMLKKKPQGQETRDSFGWCGTGRIAEDNYAFSSVDSERRQADRLLSIWDRKTNVNEQPGPLEFSENLFHLGVVSGKVLLPTPALTKPGIVRVYLLAEGTERAGWIDRTETERLDCELGDPTKYLSDLVDQISFEFGSVTPGKYFVKAVWDKRSPFTDFEQAGPGDYESKLHGPIEVKAGSVLNDISVHCHIRHPEGENYYRADAASFRSWKISGDLSPESFDPQSGAYFSRPASHWIVKTNVPPRTKKETLSRIVLKEGLQNESDAKLNDKTALHFYFTGGPNVPRDSELTLIDEHGCRFHGQQGTFGMVRRQHFPKFPRAADHFRVVDAKGSFDFTLKNLVKTNLPVPKIEALPAVRQFGGISMNIKAVRVNHDRPEVHAFFSEDGASAKGFRVTDCLFFERDGSPLDLENMCVREPAVEVRGSVVEDADRAPIQINLQTKEKLKFDSANLLEVETNLFGATFRIIGIAWGAAHFQHRRPGDFSLSGGEFHVDFRTGGKASIETKVPRLIVEGPAGTTSGALYVKTRSKTLELNMIKPDLDLESRGYWFPEINFTESGLQLLAVEKRPFSIVIERPKKLARLARTALAK